MNLPESNRTSPTLRGQEGSAYLAVLMLLVVLTILGLSLSVITQTEVIIGGSERQTSRQFYNADSSINISAMHVLVNRNPAGRMMTLARREETIFGESTTLGDRTCTTPFAQLRADVCNLCGMNQDNNFFATSHAVTANALRHGDDAMASRKQIGSVIVFEPWERSFESFSYGGEELTDRGDKSGVIDINTSTETDPCEGLDVKF
jgi:Tfp pilus assembly protein PilX